MIAALLATQAAPVAAPVAQPPKAEAQKPATKPGAKDQKPSEPLFKPTEVKSTGSVTVGGRRIAYHAVAGTLVVHSKDWTDTDAIEAAAKKADKDEDEPKAEASMFYAAYFRDGVPTTGRPITFLFNGGQGSSTVWLHMGAFGPVRVQALDERHTPAPYSVVNNDQSLLDASDLVFIDAPGTGFSRVAGKDKEKAFYGVDQDIDAFAQFITQFLSKYRRWDSPKYVFGESYGTMRGAGLALALQKRDVDLNGLILLSDILNWDLVPDDPQLNPGIDLSYVVALPTYAATAWYHNRVANRPAELQSFLAQVEAFATDDYALALMKGNELPDSERQRIAQQLSAYTGLPVAYLLKTDLRIEYGAFQKEFLADQEITTGTLDTRFPAIALAVAFVALPYTLFGSAHADMRLAPYVIIAALIAIRSRDRNTRAEATLAALGIAFVVGRLASNTASFVIADFDNRAITKALDHVSHGAAVLTLTSGTCDEPWALPRYWHLGSLVISRRYGFTNDHWEAAGAQLMSARYPQAAPFEDIKSVLTFSPSCAERLNRDWLSRGERARTLQGSLDAFPRHAFNYVWLIKPPTDQYAVPSDLIEIWRERDNRLYRVAPLQPRKT